MCEHDTMTTVNKIRPSPGTVYKANFDAKSFLKQYFSRVDFTPLQPFYLEGLHKLVAERTIPEGSRLLDIGSGPSIASVISAGAHCREIVCSDYVEGSLVEIRKWVNAEEDGHDWTPFFKYVCDLEGNRENWFKRQEHIRQAIKHVVLCDVNAANPLEPLDLGEFDVIVCGLCLENGCADEQAYNNGVKNIVSLLKPGGILLLYGVHAGGGYTSGEQTFLNLVTTPEMLQSAFADAGLVVLSSYSKESANSFAPDGVQVMHCESAIRR